MRSEPVPGRRHSPGTADGVRPSMNDVARHAGVALGTVSNVLNNPHKVADRTRRRVEAAIADLGFVRNSAARTLAAGATDTVGLVLVDIGNSLFVDIARGVESAAAAAGLKVLLANSDVDQAKQDAYLHLFDEARVAGLLLAPLDGPLDAAHVVQSHGRPVVLINAPAVDEGMCTVTVNEELGGYLAAQHLLNQGARRLAFLGGPFDLRAISQRLDGVRRAAAEAAAELAVVEAHSLNIGAGRVVGRTLLEASPAIDGVVCASDPLAVGVIQAATDLAIAVPEQLVVIGYDDNHFAAESAIPVSTIAQPGRQMGEAAAQLLLQEINDATGHRHAAVVLDPQLIARRSTEYLGRSAAAV
jgi:LacI family transcriptional regulator